MNFLNCLGSPSKKSPKFVTIADPNQATFTVQFLFLIIQFRRIWSKCLKIKSRSTRTFTQQTVEKAKKFLKDHKTTFWDLMEEIQKLIDWPVEGELDKKTQVKLSRKMEILVERLEKDNVYWIITDLIKDEKRLYFVDKSFWNVKHVGFESPPKIDPRIYEHMSILECKSIESMVKWLDGSKNAFYSNVIRLEEPFLERWDYTAQKAARNIGMKIFNNKLLRVLESLF